jgi:hypothetical protein
MKPCLFFHRTPSTLRPVAAGALSGRCLFANDYLCIWLLTVPCGRDVGGCFAGCDGILLVSFGKLQIQTADGHRVLRQGDSWPLPSGAPFHLWADGPTDVVFFERRPTVASPPD